MIYGLSHLYCHADSVNCHIYSYLAKSPAESESDSVAEQALIADLNQAQNTYIAYALWNGYILLERHMDRYPWT